MEHVIEHTKMEALKALADTNMKVSEARATLSKLEETETEYLVERERRTMKRIDEVLEDSRGLIAETVANYHEVQRFHQTVSSFADSLNEAYERFATVAKLLEERDSLWNANAARQEGEISEGKKMLTVDRVKIANEKKSIEMEQKKLDEGNRKLKSDQGAVERSIQRLKEKRY